MKKKEVKRKSMKGIKTVIYGRTLIVISAFLIQFAFLFASYLWLREYSYIVYVFLLCSVLL